MIRLVAVVRLVEGWEEEAAVAVEVGMGDLKVAVGAAGRGAVGKAKERVAAVVVAAAATVAVVEADSVVGANLSPGMGRRYRAASTRRHRSVRKQDCRAVRMMSLATWCRRMRSRRSHGRGCRTEECRRRCLPATRWPCTPP